MFRSNVWTSPKNDDTKFIMRADFCKNARKNSACLKNWRLFTGTSKISGYNKSAALSRKARFLPKFYSSCQIRKLLYTKRIFFGVKILQYMSSFKKFTKLWKHKVECFLNLKNKRVRKKFIVFQEVSSFNPETQCQIRSNYQLLIYWQIFKWGSI